MLNGNELYNYIETAGESSRRTRWVLLVMITTCILIFAAFLNSREGNWIDERIEVCRYAFNCFKDLKDKVPKDCEDKKSLECRAVKYINKYQIKKRADVELLLMGYLKSKQDYIQIIRVPFFSITFDVNDLGFISGLSFIFILLFLRFCLWRELMNIKTVFEKAKNNQDCKDWCFTIMSMKQVLTIPPHPAGEPPKLIKRITTILWEIVIKLIFITPLIAHSLVTYNDIKTKDIGNILSPENMKYLEMFNIIFGIVILLLTIDCIFHSIKINMMWSDPYGEKKMNKNESSTKKT